MTSSAARPLPESEYRWMSVLLRGGLLASLTLLVGALTAFARTHPDLTVARGVATNPILEFLGLPGLASGLAAGDPAAYLTLGLLAMVATPILRVAAGFYYFRRGRERGMEAITLSVLVLLLVGLLVLGPFIR